MLGAVAGYSGGGSFQLEMFYATHDGTELTSLLIDLEDKISSKEIDFFTDVSEESQKLCSKCEDVILDWINIEAWEDAEQLLLENSHNELAPRVHNSGHWTLDGSNVNQFEQHIRAISGLPLLTPERYADVSMYNLIGTLKPSKKLHKNAKLYLYGKNQVRPGRKMGHINLIKKGS